MCLRLCVFGLETPSGLVFAEDVAEHAHHLAQRGLGLYRLDEGIHEVGVAAAGPGRRFQGAQTGRDCVVIPAATHLVEVVDMALFAGFVNPEDGDGQALILSDEFVDPHGDAFFAIFFLLIEVGGVGDFSLEENRIPTLE